MEPREHAEKLVNYFGWVAREYGSKEVWEKGQATAAEWLRLIETESISAEVSAFLRMVHANRYRSSGWFELAWAVYHWVASKGIPVLPVSEFFASGSLFRHPDSLKLNAVEHAQILKEGFQQCCDEDPASEVWTEGVKMIDEWVLLMRKAEKVDGEIAQLAEKARENQSRFSSPLWHDTVWAISLWCEAVGHPDLAPRRVDKPPETQR